MEKTIRLLMQIIKNEIVGESLDLSAVQQIEHAELFELFTIAQKHDLTHIVAVCLQKNGFLGDDLLSKKFSNSMYIAMIRYEKIQYEFERICELFEKEKIMHIPLKGAVIRAFYAERWLRTSCDIDILIRPEDLDKACELLNLQLNYKAKPRAYKDVLLCAPSGVHLELHFMICEDMENLDKVLCKVWEYAKPSRTESYSYEMDSEFFLFYIFAHMYYHFSRGGCGIRTFVDVWLLTKRLQYDEVLLEKFFEESNIKRFACAVGQLTKIWFENEPYDELSKEMEIYVIKGGAGGTKETSMATKKIKTSGKLEFLFKRLFMPYRHLSIPYPILKKMPILYPYFTVVRWCNIMRKDVFNRVTYEAKLNVKIEQEQVEQTKRLFEKLEM